MDAAPNADRLTSRNVVESRRGAPRELVPAAATGACERCRRSGGAAPAWREPGVFEGNRCPKRSTHSRPIAWNRTVGPAHNVIFDLLLDVDAPASVLFLFHTMNVPRETEAQSPFYRPFSSLPLEKSYCSERVRARGRCGYFFNLILRCQNFCLYLRLMSKWR